MELAQRALLLGRETVRRDDQEIAVAVPVGAAQRERAGQISADEVVAEDRGDTRDELRQQLVQLWKARAGDQSSFAMTCLICV